MKWNVDPIIFTIGPFALRYYSLMFVIGFFTMGHYVSKIFKENDKDPELVSSLTVYIIVGMLIGSRVAHCLFYEPEYYSQHLLEVLYVWQGGLASHGGFLGVIVAVALFLKKHKDIKFLWLMDAIAAPCMFVGSLIRIGNFMNSEIYGAPTDVPWGIIFESVDNLPRHPSQLYEFLGYFIFSIFLALCFKRKENQWRKGTIFLLALLLSFGYRFFIEFTKTEQSTVTVDSFINMGQWLSIVFVIGAGSAMFFLPKNKINNK
jgi:phosphatidylglycerol:prolipoprotein diacylglycerol transferase